MVGEAFAGLSAIKTAFDLVKGLKEASDATVRNRIAADLLEKLIAAREAQQVCLERVHALETEIATFKTWEAEKDRYQLQGIGSGAVAYMTKPAMRGTEAPHWLCPTCFAKGQKAFFQPTGAHLHNRGYVYRCNGCQANITLSGHPVWID